MIKINTKYKLLGEICEIITGIPDDRKDDKKNHKYLCLKPSSLSHNNEITELSEVYRSSKISDNAIIKEKDILIKRLSPSYVNVVDEVYENAYVTSNIMIIRLKQKYSANYIALVLEIKGLSMLSHYTKKGVTVQTISKKELSNIKVPIIEYGKQHALGELWMFNKQKNKLMNEIIDEEKELIKSIYNKVLKLEE